MTELPKTFDPAEIESRWYAYWEATGQFHPDRPGAEPWTIVNPPPNVTGSLHIGHALDNTLQDILTRHARLKGKDALWVVGTDHAGIATQMVVERRMNAAGEKRIDYAREAFVEKVWDWKRESGGEITRQLRRLGCSMDWANEQFTMDPHFSKAVLKVFVDLYNEGLLYRDKRLVNWDLGLGTAISDLEVETREVAGKFWHLRYPLADGSGHISVATTRPETMLADMAIAVNPRDERYQHLIGEMVRLPITSRLIPIIADEHADPELGSGAVKITPGHDFNDFEVGKRADIRPSDMWNMLDGKGMVVAPPGSGIPADYVGMDRFDARKKVVARMEEIGLLERVEDRTIQTPYGDRSGVVIEPWLTDQWYVDAATLAKPAIEAVRSGAIRIVPKTWEKTFFNWMENIQPWCVSRQLWWGHRIPAWFGPVKDGYGHDGYLPIEAKPGLPLQQSRRVLTPFVAETEAQALRLAQSYYGDDVEVEIGGSIEVSAKRVVLAQDSDVLDTWFSSALWPFATLGWPERIPPPEGEGDHAQHGGGGLATSDTPGGKPPPPPTSSAVPLPVPGRNLGGRYPNDVLISGFDILFFWNARMMMQGLHFMGDVPFKTLYLHGLVRAADGAKMSKSKGNTVDPLGLIDKYGADALRFFMAAMESQGRDIKMDEKRVEGYRNFATKLWNAARFAQGYGIGGSTTLEPPAATLAVNKWIVAETVVTIQAVDLALADYRFDGAANAIYQFVWSRFCDWYLELIKPPMVGDERGMLDDETKAVAGWVLDQILVILHPFMPFITEELWHALAPRDHDLIVGHWPMADARAIDPAASQEIDWIISVISDLRAERLAVGFKPSDIVPIGVQRASASQLDVLNRHLPIVRRMARLVPSIISSPKYGEEGTWGADDQDYFVNSEEFETTSFVTAQLHAAGLTFPAWSRGFIDLNAERVRIEKAIAAAEKERDALNARLSNASFVERAKPEAVEKAQADHADKAAEAERLRAALGRLG